MITTPSPGDTDNKLLQKILSAVAKSAADQLGALATEATVSTLAKEATVQTLATEHTVATLATQATVATLATEATLVAADFGIAKDGATFTPAYAADARVPIAIDRTSGGVLCHTRQLTVATDAVVAAGDVADNAVDSGNPVKVGGIARANTSEPPTLSAGDRAQFTTDLFGRLMVISTGKEKFTIFSSAARIGSPTAATATSLSSRGLLLFISVTASSGSPLVTFSIDFKDEVSGLFFPVLDSVPIGSAGTYLLQIGPAFPAVPHLSATSGIPRTVQIRATHSNTDSITYSVGLQFTL